MTEIKPTKGRGKSEDQRVEERFFDALTLDSPHTFTTQRGVVLQLQKVPKYLTMDAAKKFKKIHPPLVDIGGGAMEQNPNDPDYIDAVAEQDAEKGVWIMKLYLARGSTVKYRPEDVEPPESTGWSEALEELGFEPFPQSGQLRYHAWLVNYVLLDNEFDDLWKKIARYSGMNLKEDVDTAVESFKSAPERRTDPERATDDTDTD